MSTAQNKRIVQQWNRRIWLGDDAVYDELLTPDCVFHWLGGRAEIRATIRRVRESFVDLEIHIEDQIAAADRVVTRWTLDGVHRGALWGVAATGKAISYTGITINRLNNGRIAEEWCQTDLIGLMQQIGAWR